MRRALLFLALLLPFAAAAFTWVKPLPREFTNNEHCLPYQTYTTPEAEIRVGWCHTDDPAGAGQWMWRPYVWQWCVKTKCNTVPAGLSLVNALDTIKNAADPVTALQALAAQLRVAPTATEQTQLDIVWSRACKAMSTPPYPGGPPQGWTPGWVFAANYCPSEPAPSSEVWLATGAAIFTVANGKLSGVTARKAALGAACNSTTLRIVVGTTTYMPLASGPITEATACRKT